MHTLPVGAHPPWTARPVLQRHPTNAHRVHDRRQVHLPAAARALPGISCVRAGARNVTRARVYATTTAMSTEHGRACWAIDISHWLRSHADTTTRAATPQHREDVAA